MVSVEIQGHCDERFARVKDAFARNFEADDEVGATWAVFLDGEPVIDIWGGHADAARTRPWERDTICNVWSVTKAMTATCAHVLVDRGQLDLDMPVAHYWPEFAQAGKSRIPVRWLLSHQAGLFGIDEPLPTEALYDWDRMCAALAAQEPLIEPGTQSGYHAITFGYLVGEVVRRISGKRLGTFFRDEVATPLGADFWIGLPESEEPRVAEMVPTEPVQKLAQAPARFDDSPKGRILRARANPPITQTIAWERAWRAAEIPAANGQGNARSCARVMAMLAGGGTVDGLTILSQAAVENAITEQVSGIDVALGGVRWGLGFMLQSEWLPLSPNPRTFGHGGWGGAFAVADMDARLGAAYVMNRQKDGTTGDKRLARLIRSTYAAIEESRPR